MKNMKVISAILLVCASMAFTTTAQAQAYWNQPWQVKHCTGSGTRQFASQLMNIPWGVSWESFCSTMPADINGQHFDRPTRCINNAGMWGEFDGVRDSSCSPYWGPFTPGACSNGSRIHSGQLFNITGDWMAACVATPAWVAGQSYSPPALRCQNRGVAGMWGEVSVADTTCSDIVVRGTVTFEDGTVPSRAFNKGTVEVWACANWVGPSCSWSKLMSTATDAYGSYSVTLPGPRSLADRYNVRVVGENPIAYIYAQDTLNLFWADLGAEQTATAAKRTLVFDRFFRASGGDLYVTRHLNAVQKMQPAHLMFNTFRDKTETDILTKVAISPSIATGTAFMFSGMIHVNPDSLMSDAILLHEYAHFAQENIGAYYPDARVHWACMQTDPTYAWFEGFPAFFDKATRRMKTGNFPSPPPAAISDLASYTPSCLPAFAADSYEGVVTEILYLLLNDGSGTCQGSTDPDCVTKLWNKRAKLIFGIFDKEFDYSAPGDKTLARFRQLFVERGGPKAYTRKVFEKFGL